jgi:peptide/nickel transport system permease protein
MTETLNTEVLTDISEAAAPADETSLRRFISDFTENRVAVGALAVFLVIVSIAIFAPLISPQNPYDLAEIDILDGRLPPGSEGMTGITFWIGNDDQGRDMLSAIFYGLRISLGVGAMSGFIALCLGTCIGLAAAYFGGRVDTLIMRLVVASRNSAEWPGISGVTMAR